MLFDGEAGFDGFLTGPVFAVRLALDEDGLDVGVAVPPESDRFRTFSLFETAEVQVKVLVVEVDGGDS